MTLEEIKIEEFENKIYDKYITLFPEEEQRDWNMIQDAYKKGLEKFYKIINNDEIIGFFMLEKMEDNYPYYLDYFAIYKENQNSGLGTLAIKTLLKKIIGDNNELCIEIEKENEKDPITLRRAEFYKRLGFKRVDSEYVLYNVSYTPYIYTKKENPEKEKIDEIMFKYYVANCGKKEADKNCKKVK